MWHSLAKISCVFAVCLFGSGCGPNGRVTSRSVHAVASGGQQEVWIVMGETGHEVSGNTVTIDHDQYSVYHCVPVGCKRVGELAGTEAVAR